MSQPANERQTPTPPRQISPTRPFLSDADRTGSEYTLVSTPVNNGGIPKLPTKPTAKPGPPEEKTPVIASTWGIGWKTPTMMLTCYILAILIAISHLLMFRYLNGKYADGINQAIPQSYVTTISNILANAFGFAIRGALAVAFAQYLWTLLRVQTMRVSTIELLFCIRNNPFLLLKGASIRAAPSLCLLALLMWGTQVATSFPPGAITVASVQSTSYEMVPVPTYDGSFMGNRSGADAKKFALDDINMSPDSDGFVAYPLTDGTNAELMNRIAFSTLVSGESFPEPSPCGSNCSYTTQMEAPYIDCDNTLDVTFWNDTYIFDIYNGTFRDRRTLLGDPTPPTGNYSESYYKSSTLTPLLANPAAVSGTANNTVLIQENGLNCLFWRANYTVSHNYTNNIHLRKVSISPIERLVNLEPKTHNSYVPVPGFVEYYNASDGTHKYRYGSTPANWTDYASSFYRDANHMAIVASMFLWLVGTFPATPIALSNYNVSLYDPYTSKLLDNLGWSLSLNSGVYRTVNQTIVDRTRLNTAFYKYNVNETANPSFNVTQDSLNDVLFNITTSVLGTYQYWNTTSNATILNTLNIYSFSSPITLLLPYFLSILLAFPFMILGFWALVRNGVAATDGGFIQIISTSTGSAILDSAAAGGCLGGDESVPRELRDLKVRFGEFVGQEGVRVRRAGFGVEGEVRGLDRGVSYGIEKWI